jgi:acetyl esterase/lipase
MKRIVYVAVAICLVVLSSGCDVLLKGLAQSQAANAAANIPARAKTIAYPPNKDRIAILGYAPGAAMTTPTVANGTRYKDFIFTDVDVKTEYYKKGAPTWDGGKKDLVADIITPKNDNQKNRPCFIFLFGGGFSGKFNDCTEEVCKGLALKGYVTVVADYRIGFSNALLSVQCQGDFNTGMYPAYVRSIQDARSLVRYLKANAERLGIDRERIFISGQSAGALTSIGVALMDANNAPKVAVNQVGNSLDPMNDNMQYNSNVAGVVAMAGAVFDPMLAINRSNVAPICFISGTCDELIDMYQGNAFRCKDKNTFPTIYGGAAIYEAMKDKNDVQFNLICNGGHGMGTVGYSKLVDIITDFTYSVLQKKPITGKQIINAEKGVCNKPDICK